MYNNRKYVEFIRYNVQCYLRGTYFICFNLDRNVLATAIGTGYATDIRDLEESSCFTNSNSG
jgi:hypothetical protein